MKYLVQHKHIEIEIPPDVQRSILVAKKANMLLQIVTYEKIFEKIKSDNIAVEKPCPCGHFGNPKHPCRCQPSQITKHQQRLNNVDYLRIEGTLSFRKFKFKGLSEICIALLKQAYMENFVDVAGLVIALKTAEAIANIENSDKIKPEHIAEALMYRKSLKLQKSHINLKVR